MEGLGPLPAPRASGEASHEVRMGGGVPPPAPRASGEVARSGLRTSPAGTGLPSLAEPRLQEPLARRQMPEPVSRSTRSRDALSVQESSPAEEVTVTCDFFSLGGPSSQKKEEPSEPRAAADTAPAPPPKKEKVYAWGLSQAVERKECEDMEAQLKEAVQNVIGEAPSSLELYPKVGVAEFQVPPAAAETLRLRSDALQSYGCLKNGRFALASSKEVHITVYAVATDAAGASDPDFHLQAKEKLLKKWRRAAESLPATPRARMAGFVEVAIQDPELAEDVCSDPEYSSVKFFTNCDCFFLIDAPQDSLEAIKQSLKREHAKILHCGLDDNSGMGFALIGKGSYLASYSHIPLPGGERAQLSQQMQYPVYLQGLPENVPAANLLERLDLKPNSASYDKSTGKLVVANSTERQRLLQHGSFSCNGEHVRILPRSGRMLPFSESWYKNCHEPKVLPASIDEIPDDSPLFSSNAQWNFDQWRHHFQAANSLQDYHFANIRKHALQRVVMLQTVQAVRKKGYVLPDSRRVAVEQDPERSVAYTLDKPLQLRDGLPTYSCKVNVVREDCLLAAHRIQQQEKSTPCVLNMASDKSPGGGFLKGDGAQEETLFRRSNYYRSLGGLETAYPSPEYPWKNAATAVLTRKVTVFRGPQEQGYRFEEVPYVLDFIAVAAVRNPKTEIKNGLEALTPREASILRHKIQHMFVQLANLQQHQHLVLSALGCGAFHNPPHHVAMIFHDLLQVYGPLFKSVTFAIIADHNSKGDVNLESFLRRLDGLVVHPRASPFKWPKEASCSLPPCNFGGLCRDVSKEEHRKTFSHPPLCPEGAKCQDHGEVHHHLLWHPRPCDRGARCPDWRSEEHAAYFTHPKPCRFGAGCTSTDPKHLAEFLHEVPVCPGGPTCPKKEEPGHSQKFRHPRPTCSLGPCCPNIFSEAHFAAEAHDVLPPCRDLVGCKGLPQCPNSHLCAYGMKCRDISDPGHLRKYLHFARRECTEGQRCLLLQDPSHVAFFSHGPFEWPLKKCRHGASCTEKAPEHFAEFHHPPQLAQLPLCRVQGSLLDTDRADLFANKEHLEKKLKHHRLAISPEDVDPEIVDWVRRLRPQHRCKPEIFESICEHGVVMSASHMLDLGDEKRVNMAVMSHPAMVKILEAHAGRKSVMEQVEDYVTKQVLYDYAVDRKDSAQTQTRLQTAAALAASILRQIPGFKSGAESVETLTQRVAAASLQLSKNKKGRHAEEDKIMKTNSGVFSILGPNSGAFYGSVILQFNQDILYHADTHLTVNAAPSYLVGTAGEWRPWSGVKPDKSVIQLAAAAAMDNARGGRLAAAAAVAAPAAAAAGATVGRRLSADELANVDVYNRSAIHPCVYKWENVVAAELASMARIELGVTGRVSLEDVIEFCRQSDPHKVIEAHLPGLIPFSYVETIMFPTEVEIPKKTMEALRNMFGDRLSQILIRDVDSRTEIREANGECPIAWDRAQKGGGVVPRGVPCIQRRGLTMSLPKKMFADKQGNVEARMPLKLNPSRNLVHLLFSVPAQDHLEMETELFVILKSAADPSQSLTIFLSAATGLSYISVAGVGVHKQNLKVDPKYHVRLCDVTDFSKRAAPLGWLDYHIEILPGKTLEVCVKHFGLSSIFNHQQMRARNDKVRLDRAGSELLVSFSTASSDVVLHNVLVRRDVPAPPHLARPERLPSAPAASASAESSQDSAGSPTSFVAGLVDSGRSMLQHVGQRLGLTTGEELSEEERLWEFEEARNRWQRFSPEQCALLSAKAKSGSTVFEMDVPQRGKYRIDLQGKLQTNVKTGTCRRIRVCEPDHAAASASTGHIPGPAVQSRDGARSEILVWQAELQGRWEDLPQDVSQKLNELQSRGVDAATLSIWNSLCEVDLRGKRCTVPSAGQFNLRVRQAVEPSRAEARTEEPRRHGSHHPTLSQPSGEQPPHSSGHTARKWEVRGDDRWLALPDDVARSLDEARAAGHRTCRFTARHQTYEINFQTMKQVNVATQGKKRDVRCT